MNHTRCIDPAPARRFAYRIDIGAVFERQSIDAENAIDRRINGEGDDQVYILAAI
jgi:hypothetical protein